MDYMRVCYKECEPLSLRRGVAYIEFARPLLPSVTKGFKVHKDGDVTGNACNKDT